jgi:tRNA A37 methylthiotransferase MiaB
VLPKIGFVSLGCPKALVDSERILTQLRAEGYATAKDYVGADLVIVNTCGFIDAAVEESLGAIGAAANAPEIDGTVRFRGGKAGEFRQVTIERASAHDLHGRLT